MHIAPAQETAVVRLVVRSPRRVTGGRRFQAAAELSLEPTARRAMRALPGAESDLIVVKEAAGPFGIPDFVALVGGRDRLQRRRKARVAPLLNDVDTTLVAAAHSAKPLSLDSIARRSSLPTSAMQRRLPALVKSGALLSAGPSSYVRHPALEPCGRLYAVEMKVRDWRKALHQCRRYSVWTDSYVLVLGKAPPQRSLTELIANVRSDRGGLVVGDDVVLRAGVRTPPPGRRLLASEYFFASVAR